LNLLLLQEDVVINHNPQTINQQSILFLLKRHIFKVKSYDLKLTVEIENNVKLHLIITATNLSPPLLQLKGEVVELNSKCGTNLSFITDRVISVLELGF
jgi:hypothetical protein